MFFYLEEKSARMFSELIPHMHDTEIQKRIRLAGFTEIDACEVLRIYHLLTHKKKVQVLDRWDSIVESVKKRRAQIEKEKSILLENATKTIHTYVESYSTKIDIR